MTSRTPEAAPLTRGDHPGVADGSLYNGALDGIPRGASVLRANAVIIHARLAAALATYRDSLDRDALREERARHRISF